MLVFLLALTQLAVPPSPAGLQVLDCDGPGLFFFDGGLVVHEIDNCGPAYLVTGRWRRDGDDVVVTWEQKWATRGVGPPGTTADCGPIYERYEATVEPVQSKPDRFGRDAFKPPTPDKCGGTIPHARSADPHVFLRRFVGKHPETSQRVLSADDLKAIPAQELRLIRNEIFARYGLQFRDPELRNYFEKQLGHPAVMVNVDAFLSETERANVAVLLAAEKAAQRR